MVGKPNQTIPKVHSQPVPAFDEPFNRIVIEHLFPDIPTRTDKIYHDVNFEDSQPVKQHPYRMNPTKQKYLKEEIQYLLDNDFIEPSQIEYSFP